ncbi:hypothetical protein L0U85_03790 [Glycomyces sp. L485]|nr:hypothetical protein [Glycomyces sp. L485]
MIEYRDLDATRVTDLVAEITELYVEMYAEPRPVEASLHCLGCRCG